jgi:hypothetical protein
MDDSSRIFFFLTACIPIRLFVTYLAFWVGYHNITWLYGLGIIALLCAISMMKSDILWSTGTCEGGVGGPIWWSNTRFIFSICLFVFFLLCMVQNTHAWVALAIGITANVCSSVIQYV